MLGLEPQATHILGNELYPQPNTFFFYFKMNFIKEIAGPQINGKLTHPQCMLLSSNACYGGGLHERLMVFYSLRMLYCKPSLV